MSSKYQEKAGYGTAFWEDDEKRVKKDGSPNPYHPDFRGFLILDMDYKAGDKLKIDMWQKQTSRGTTMLSIKEDNFTRKLKMTPQEDRAGYQRKGGGDYAYRPKNVRDEDVPF